MTRVSSSLGTTDTPAATRAETPGWRDPRMWVGIAIVAGSMVVGAMVLGASDDTEPVWAAARTMGTGHVLTADDVTVRHVRFADASDADLYYPAARPLPGDLRLVHAVGAGELLPRGAVGSAENEQLRQVPISVAADQVPGDVSAGTSVDVYLRPSSHDGCQGSPVCNGDPALSGVLVLDAPPVDQDFGAGGQRMLVLAMSTVEAHRFFRLLASVDEPVLTVVGRG
jgi:hypothetical protein